MSAFPLHLRDAREGFPVLEPAGLLVLWPLCIGFHPRSLDQLPARCQAVPAEVVTPRSCDCFSLSSVIAGANRYGMGFATDAEAVAESSVIDCCAAGCGSKGWQLVCNGRAIGLYSANSGWTHLVDALAALANQISWLARACCAIDNSYCDLFGYWLINYSCQPKSNHGV